MTDNTAKEAEREPPDPDQLSRMRENAVNASHTNMSSSQREVRAQILQTQQLNYDVHQLNQNIEKLNGNLQTFAMWSRYLTMVLILLGLLQLALAIFPYLTGGG